ncbi:MAG: SDR family NAD(P)-dependent oxidoreductase [Hyphomicrobiales bacterium]
MGRLAGRIALITGATGGIGTEMTQVMAGEGARVISTGPAPGDTALPEGAEFMGLDVTSSDAVRAVIAEIGERYGRLDVLVNAAGIELEKTVEETSEEEWDRLIDINLKGTFLTCKYALPLLRKSESGSIVNFGSYDGFIADPKLAAYCASKGGVHALTRAIAVDHGPDGIRCNAVCPGYIDTPMMQSFLGDAGTTETVAGEIARVTPIGRVGSPRDVANMVLWLASDEARFATGQLFVIDGGLSAQVQQMRL